MKLAVLGIIALIVVGYTAFMLFRPPQGGSIFSAGNKTQSVQGPAIQQAKKIYNDKKNQKTDFEKSPCLSEDMGNGWALDIVHNPRLQVDDQNVCNSYSQGTVKHIVEMTPDGKIIRVE